MSGYSIRLALRHLIVGLRNPRGATREAIEAGLGEFERLSLIILAAGSFAVTSDQTRAVFDRHVAETDQSSLPVLILLWIFAVLLAGTVHYIIGSILVAGMLSALRIPDWTFSGVRSAWVIAMWISSIPTLVFLLGESLLLAEWESTTWHGPFMLTLTGIWTTYRTFCLVEISGASLLQAFVAAAFAGLGLYVLSGFIERVEILLPSL